MYKDMQVGLGVLGKKVARVQPTDPHNSFARRVHRIGLIHGLDLRRDETAVALRELERDW
jgi:hypothetical protein